MDQTTLVFTLCIFFILVLFILFGYGLTQYIRNQQMEIRREAHIGDLKLSTLTEDHAGWLLCDGRDMLCEEFIDLYSVLGTSFGSSNPESFRLPDGRGRVLGSAGQGVGLTNRPISSSTGKEVHALTVAELVAHTHTGTTDVSGTHVHTATTSNAGAHTHSGTTTDAGTHTHSHNAPGGQNQFGLAIADGTNTVTGTDPSQGELNVWRTAQGLSLNSAGGHTHAFTSDSNGSHVHTLTTESNGNHIHPFTSNATGGSQPFSLMQPSLFAGNLFVYYGFRKEILA